MGTDRRFVVLGTALRDALTPVDQALVNAAVTAVPDRRTTYGFADVGRVPAAALALLSPEASRAAVALLAADAVDRIEAQGVPTEVVTRARVWSDRLLDFLGASAEGDYRYPGDLFLKDYRFATGMTVPCGAQVIDMAERPGPKTLLKLAVSRPARAVRAATAPWFRPHTEGRYLDEFSEAGWNSCYLLVAELLRMHPHVRGLIATSWFYDPQLASVSPRLSYLRDQPVRGGALTVAHGTTEFDIQSATSASPTRRRLYEEGRYRPVCHSILWFRDDLLTWAANWAGTGDGKRHG